MSIIHAVFFSPLLLLLLLLLLLSDLNKVSHSSSAKFQSFPICPIATQKGRLYKLQKFDLQYL